MTTLVGRLLAPLLESNELVAEIDEGHGVALAAQLEREEPAVERQRLIDVADLDRNVIDADKPRFLSFGPDCPPILVLS